jgi:hypothetical protein
MNVGAALAFEADVLDGAELELRKKRVIMRREFAQSSAVGCIHFGQRPIVRLEQRRMATSRG